MGEFTDNIPLLVFASMLFLATVFVFPLLMFLTIRKRHRAVRQHGSVSGALLGGTVTGTYGEVAALGNTSLVDVRFRVVGVTTPRATAVGLELHGHGFAHRALFAVRLDGGEIESVASWLEHAATGATGQPTGGLSWSAYEIVIGATVRGLHGSLEKTVNGTHWKLHIVAVSDERAPVAVLMRATVLPFSDQVRGARLTPEAARELSRLLRGVSRFRDPRHH